MNSLKGTESALVASEAAKISAAKKSVFAAVLLCSTKLVVGLATQSLGILAEAAHSALDLVAAVVTWLAVRVAGKPADEEHLYGHGKIENLSALFETLLLLLTCVWIIYEARQRLLFNAVPVEVSIWSFAVLLLSIGVDVSRSRMLYRAAEEHHSQALEADALHFSTDIWSSCVVLLGLVCVGLGKLFPNFAFLVKADAVAAIGVALIVIYVSIELGLRTIHALLDRAPIGMAQQIKNAVEQLEGIEDCHHIRVRNSGAQIFVDVHILVDGSRNLSDVHSLTEEVERAVQNLAPNADVTVHPEPRE